MEYSLLSIDQPIWFEILCNLRYYIPFYAPLDKTWSTIWSVKRKLGFCLINWSIINKNYWSIHAVKKTFLYYSFSRFFVYCRHFLFLLIQCICILIIGYKLKNGTWNVTRMPECSSHRYTDGLHCCEYFPTCVKKLPMKKKTYVAITDCAPQKLKFQYLKPTSSQRKVRKWSHISGKIRNTAIVWIRACTHARGICSNEVAILCF